VTSESRASIDAGNPRRTDPADSETFALPVGYTRIEGRSGDASAGVLPRLRDHLRTGHPSACPTPCLPLAGPSSLARDPHVALGRRVSRRCRAVFLGVLVPSLMQPFQHATSCIIMGEGNRLRLSTSPGQGCVNDYVLARVPAPTPMPTPTLAAPRVSTDSRHSSLSDASN